ncbi:hypothetical protein TNCV_2079411 [Trichonephila clavipes]|nr:hypothetical protein TNCV_2079411 [Trichonephila clavipes]
MRAVHLLVRGYFDQQLACPKALPHISSQGLLDLENALAIAETLEHPRCLRHRIIHDIQTVKVFDRHVALSSIKTNLSPTDSYHGYRT